MCRIPPTANAEFVYHMEDVLDVYHRPTDPQHPVVCLDEATKQLIGEVREPLPAKSGEVERCNCEYVRNGMATLFVAVDPVAGWRKVTVTAVRPAGRTSSRSCWTGAIATSTR